MQLKQKNAAVFLMLIGILNCVWAANLNTPAGLWITHDDKGKPTGYVRVQQDNGIYTGVIEKSLETDLGNEQVEQYCTACKDERKGQKLIGMTIIKNVKAKGDVYEGTEILDPFSGNTYRVKLTPTHAGQKLEVRGFVGLSLFGRTQIWERANHE